MKTNLKHTLISIAVPLEYQIFVEEGARNTSDSDCHRHSLLLNAKRNFISSLIVKFCSENDSKDLEDALENYRDEVTTSYLSMDSSTKYDEKIEDISVPIELVEFIFQQHPENHEKSLQTLIINILPEYVLGIIGHYNRQFMQGEPK